MCLQGCWCLQYSSWWLWLVWDKRRGLKEGENKTLLLYMQEEKKESWLKVTTVIWGEDEKNHLIFGTRVDKNIAGEMFLERRHIRGVTQCNYLGMQNAVSKLFTLQCLKYTLKAKVSMPQTKTLSGFELFRKQGLYTGFYLLKFTAPPCKISFNCCQNHPSITTSTHVNTLYSLWLSRCRCFLIWWFLNVLVNINYKFNPLSFSALRMPEPSVQSEICWAIWRDLFTNKIWNLFIITESAKCQNN